ncbi:tRNA pseudouridine synthase [Trichinella pseudospiralis]
MDNSEARTRAVLLKAVSKMPRPLFIPTLNMMALDLLLVSLLFRTPFSVQQEMSQLLLRKEKGIWAKVEHFYWNRSSMVVFAFSHEWIVFTLSTNFYHFLRSPVAL